MMNLLEMSKYIDRLLNRPAPYDPAHLDRLRHSRTSYLINPIFTFLILLICGFLPGTVYTVINCLKLKKPAKAAVLMVSGISIFCLLLFLPLNGLITILNLTLNEFICISAVIAIGYFNAIAANENNTPLFSVNRSMLLISALSIACFIPVNIFIFNFQFVYACPVLYARKQITHLQQQWDMKKIPPNESQLHHHVRRSNNDIQTIEAAIRLADKYKFHQTVFYYRLVLFHHAPFRLNSRDVLFFRHFFEVHHAVV